MGRSKVLAAMAAAAVPFFFVAWIQLVSVDQPRQVEPGQAFTATVHGVVHSGSDPTPLYKATDAMPSRGGQVTVRLGVLVPTAWNVQEVTYKTGDFSGVLQPLPTEEADYQDLHPAPPGSSWQAFGLVTLDAQEGADITYQVRFTPDLLNGYYQLAYMTWTDGPFVAGHSEPPTSAPDQPWPLPYREPSLIQADITVGQVGPAPRVTGWVPQNAAADVPLDTDIRVTFDRDMDVQSLRDGGVSLWAGPVVYVNGSPSWPKVAPLQPEWMPPVWQPYAVPIQVFYNAATRTAVVQPQEALSADTIYTLIVDYRARAADGVPVDLVQSAGFLTAPGPDVPLFSDVPSDHRFYEAIETLARAGIAQGYPDGTFRPDDPVTRADVARMMVLLLGIHTPEMGTPPPYSDMPAADDPVADFIGEATRAGVVQGFDDGTFRPDATVTRIQLTRMIVRAAQSWLAAPPPDYDAGFADVSLSDAGYTNWAAYNQMLVGKAPGTFDPWSTATRGHAARILFGVWQHMPRPIPMR